MKTNFKDLSTAGEEDKTELETRIKELSNGDNVEVEIGDYIGDMKTTDEEGDGLSNIPYFFVHEGNLVQWLRFPRYDFSGTEPIEVICPDENGLSIKEET